MGNGPGLEPENDPERGLVPREQSPQQEKPNDTVSVISYGDESGNNTTLRVASLRDLSRIERLIIFGSKIVPGTHVAEFVERVSAVEQRSHSLRWLGGGGVALVLAGGSLASVFGLIGGLPLITVGAALSGTALIMDHRGHSDRNIRFR